jgi:oligopeptide transport system permease protein
MSLASDPAASPADDMAPVGRSLWADARARLLQNRAAVASMIFLAFLALAFSVGRLVAPHPYDQVFPDYVKAAPSLTAYPKPDQIGPAIERIAQRLRATPSNLVVEGGLARLTLESQRPIDERLLAYFDRSDLFRAARVVEKADEGKRLVVEAPIERHLFLFGTDSNGRDLLSRILLAGGISLEIGLLASLVALFIGVTWGATAGYFGGRVDMLMMRVVDILYALPFIFFVILLVVFFGRNFVLMFIAVGAIEWLDMARIVRGQTLSIKRQEYVQAAEALGVDSRGVLRRHVIPNTLGPVVVYLTLLVPKVILLESFLSFLGLGVQEPMTSLGVLISDGARNIQGSSSLLIFPAIVFISMLFALNFVGDGLRDALDPKDR